MSDINAAIGVEQLKRFSFFQKKRMILAKNYDEIFKNSGFISTFQRNYDEITPHIYAVKLLVPNSREKLQNYLLDQGIQTGYHYFPNHLLTFFQKKGEGGFETAKISNDVISGNLVRHMYRPGVAEV